MNGWLIAAGCGVLLVAVSLAGAWLMQRRRREWGALERNESEHVFVAATPSAQPSEYEVSQRWREVMHLARVSMVGELSGAIAHELNQPLTAILSNAQAAQRMLKSDLVNPREVYDILTDIVSEDKRAVQVIERLRALLTKEQTDAQVVDLTELTQEVIALAHSTLVSSKVTLAASLPPGVPSVLADRVQIQQVLLNLILNASEAMASGKEGEQRQLGVATTLANDGAVLVTVSDTGTGIAADAFDKLFNSFYTTKARGLGMGLSISKTIVEAHGGRIWAINNPGSGATFCFTLQPATVSKAHSASLVSSLAAMILLTLAFTGIADAQSGWGFLRNSPAGDFTEEDVALLEQTLDAVLASSETTPRRWTNPKTKNSGELRVVRIFTSQQGRSCKRVRMDNEARGKKGSGHYTLCQSPDGRWLIDAAAKPAIDSPAPPPQ